MHTQHAHVQQIVEAQGHYLFIVKGNQPTLLSRLKALPWREAMLNDRTDEQGHGRREIRRMKICTVRPGLPFPHAAQAIQVKRRRTDRRTGKTTIVTIYAVTSLPPGRITHPEVAALIRRHRPLPQPRRSRPSATRFHNMRMLLALVSGSSCDGEDLWAMYRSGTRKHFAGIAT
ncbi:hypothetical protein OHA25_19260 [Nonomuraea sp. NBC_00507]|uniref:hypothetical protein n=1 Tax=Nonomuraea sp. NBC_00507 TaxID=2976002 RepID=UPI002E198291